MDFFSNLCLSTISQLVKDVPGTIFPQFSGFKPQESTSMHPQPLKSLKAMISVYNTQTLSIDTRISTPEIEHGNHGNLKIGTWLDVINFLFQIAFFGQIPCHPKRTV